MEILSRDSLERSGFAGIKEHRIVTDSRIFGRYKKPEAHEGLGSFVYLADAIYDPQGESGMHPHSEIDIISVIVEGRVSHKGSMEHGKDLVAGDVQVQRAGGEGFDHNEINPDDRNNRMIQIWALPEVKGLPASYKFYQPKLDGMTRIYGGDSNQNETFASRTTIDIVNLNAGDDLELEGDQIAYITKGEAQISDGDRKQNVKDGDFIQTQGMKISAEKDVHMIVVRHAA